jgi:hypothetical protein
MPLDASDIAESVRRTGWCRLGPITDARHRVPVGQVGSPWCETAVE